MGDMGMDERLSVYSASLARSGPTASELVRQIGGPKMSQGPPRPAILTRTSRINERLMQAGAVIGLHPV